MEKRKDNFFNKIYDVVKQIPEGYVATYGQVAQMVGTRDARKIGWALHGNKNLNVPCHRVVNKEGKVALNFAFDGWEEQRKRLMDERVHFIDEMHVNLERHLWER